MPTQVVTVIQHGVDVTLDRFAAWLPGLRVRAVRAWLGDPVPADPAVVGAGLIVLGGHMNALADDVAPWLPATRTLLAASVRAGLPTLGICLGAQLLALACGGTVQVAAPRGREAGIANVRWRDEARGDAVVGELARAAGRAGTTPAPSMHADVVRALPPGATWLGASDLYPHQAFRVGTAAWGVQFHPEASAATLRGWADGHDDVDTEAVAAAYAAREAEISAAGRSIALGFAAVVRQSGTRSSASTIVYA